MASQVKQKIQKESPEAEIILMEIDLSSFSSIKRFCTEFLALRLPLNILMPLLLTELLMEKMVETAAKKGIQGRIVNVSSVVHGWVKREQFCFSQMLQPKKSSRSQP